MDKSMLQGTDLGNLAAEDEKRMNTMIDQLQIRDRFCIGSSITYEFGECMIVKI